MIKIVAGGKKSPKEYSELIIEYEKRLRKPFEINWKYMEENRLNKWLRVWPFFPSELVICCDERGDNISSDEFSQRLEKAFLDDKEVVILIGGAYGFPDEVRRKSDFVWSFSKLVFPHLLARLIVVEQIYRASQISQNRPYHHK
ncbi:MAG: 23S rRNA (pseudouridine(1915)-N(3))-methyltransferase RlmH [Candidatus Saccharibacteria bacterium]|nr:23S rRNA (pseudouridine(1915)-N(3))-methyltransferase RlmH [Candidatus Saccharibacteria bacterium]